MPAELINIGRYAESLLELERYLWYGAFNDGIDGVVLNDSFAVFKRKTVTVVSFCYTT